MQKSAGADAAGPRSEESPLPLGPFRIEYAWQTDRGRVRKHNEDAVAVDTRLGLVVVADGVGGAHAGEVASQLAIDTVAAFVRERGEGRTDGEAARRLIEAAGAEANRAIWERARRDPKCGGMGSTVVMGLVGPGWMAYANVGDSRLYRLRHHALDQLSQDHSYIHELIAQGVFRSFAEARRSGIGENILARALGSAPAVQASSGLTDIQSGDIFLLCSDGLTGMVPIDWLRQMLVAIGSSGLGPVVEAMVNLANERGGSDNITVALMRARG